MNGIYMFKNFWNSTIRRFEEMKVIRFWISEKQYDSQIIL